LAWDDEDGLTTLFDVQTIPKETQLREIVDNVDSEALRPVFKNYFEKLRRSKYLEPYQILSQGMQTHGIP